MKMTPSSTRLTLMAMFAFGVLIVLPQSAQAQSGPRASVDQVAAALVDTPKIPAGPFQPTWDSIKANYKTPEWFLDAKFGIFMHFGLYSVAAHGSEWYEKYMYGGNAGIMQWHIDNFGPLDTHGYITLADKYASKFDPAAWAALFKKAGAKYIVPTAQHHDGFANWNSAYTKFSTMNYGPKRDIIGDLATAVRKEGLKFGVSNHGMEHFTFIASAPKVPSDLLTPELADFYLVADRSPEALVKFLNTWVKQNYELIDKYQPDLLWFDNGVNGRNFDPLKLAVAAYYYNNAAQWGKQVSLSTKSTAYLAGSIEDFEREGRAPKTLTDFPWQADDPIGEKFGYVEGMKLTTSAGIIRNLIENVCRNGNLLLNISPKGDGTIPEEQQKILLGVGQWLDTNGDAIYGTRAWTIYGEDNIRYTTKGDTLYAIVLRSTPRPAPAAPAAATTPEETILAPMAAEPVASTATSVPAAPAAGTLTIPALATGKAPAGKIERVELLGHTGTLEFTQNAVGLQVKLPAEMPEDSAYALKITGLKLKSEPVTTAAN
jgi:alpha-L-fucosidase